MTVRFIRNVSLSLGGDGAISIQKNRIKFEINKSRASFVNNGVITVYNLNEVTRKQIEERYTKVLLEVGHGEIMTSLFRGEIRNVFHRREKADIATDIYVGDGDRDYQQGKVNKVIPEGTSVTDYIKSLIGEFGELTEGILNDIPDKISEWPTTLVGNVKDELNKVTKSNGLVWSIQDGRVEVSGVDKYIDSTITLSSQNGIIGTPTVTDEGVNLTTLLDPSVLPNRKIRVLSEYTDNNFADLNFQKKDTDLGGGEFVINNITFTGDTRGSDFSSFIEAQRVSGGTVI